LSGSKKRKIELLGRGKRSEKYVQRRTIRWCRKKMVSRHGTNNKPMGIMHGTEESKM